MAVPGQPMPAQAGPPAGAPQGPPQGAPKAGPSPAAQIVQGIHTGLQQLGSMMKQAGPAVSPQDHQLLDQTMKSFEALISQLQQGPGHAPPPAAAGPKGPMPANAGPGSKPAGY